MSMCLLSYQLVCMAGAFSFIESTCRIELPSLLILLRNGESVI